jgi:EAL domain-containing protein (putative c-di-GMP-specific phosphodiesterase class I)
MHPSRGLLHPSEFITVVEETPLILRLGARILEMAMVQAGAWQRETSVPLVISVNVSTRQLEDPTFPAIVANLLDCVDLVPGTLMLEVTESGLVGGVPAVLDVLQQLRSLGVRVAIDDFGTGYSSLAYLKDLPVDTLKLDKSFVDDLRYGERSVVGEAIVTLCTTLGLDVVAEGIEHPDQLEALQRLGCPNGQGFLFARPLAADEIRSIAGLTELLPSLHR